MGETKLSGAPQLDAKLNQGGTKLSVSTLAPKLLAMPLVEERPSVNTTHPVGGIQKLVARGIKKIAKNQKSS